MNNLTIWQRLNLAVATLILLLAVFGTVVAWVLVRYEFPGKRLVDALVDLPFALPTAVAGIALTTFMRSWQDFEYVQLAIVPMFLFSATFYPLSIYPLPVQWIVQAFPLWHGVELMRQISIGAFSPATWVHLLYYAVMILVGVSFTTRRLRALFLR